MFSIKVINFISLFLQSITDTLLLWFKWEIPLAGLSQGQNKTLFSDFTESRRGEFCDSQSSTDTQEHFASEGQLSSEGDSLQVPAWPVPPVCSASVPFHVTAGVFVQPLSPAPRRRWLHSQGSITAWPGCSVLEPNLLSPKQRSYYKSNLHSFSGASQLWMTDNCFWAPIRRWAVNNLTAKWCLKKWRNGLGGF